MKVNVKDAEGRVSIVDALLKDERVNVNDRVDRYQGATALQLAAMRGRSHIVERLCCVEGVDVNIADNCGRTALFCALANAHSDTVKSLLKNPDLIVTDKDLCIAKQAGNKELQRLLEPRVISKDRHSCALM
ncbi:MAG: ankyrin repeat domain-containing protein [Coxiellaceae bacterium]|nr:ankyrin repeat domain-containing protein [Coxiellaceae bacterium]